MKVVVERIENEILILDLDDGTKAEILQKLVPEAKEGDIIKFYVDKVETESRKKEMTERVNRLWKD